MKRSKHDFVLERAGDEYLLVPLKTRVVDLNGIATLNTTGRYLWECLEAERSVDDLAAALAERFEVPSNVARRDVEAFVDEMSRLGLLE